jgi:hypothetical protein
MQIYESKKLKDLVSRDGEEFLVFVGLDKKHAQQLKQYSLDDSDVELQKYTGDRKRFGEGSYEEWYAKDRTPFALVHNATDTLAAVAWLGPKPAHEGCKCHSMAWRSYKPFRGKGLMKEFTKFVLDFYLDMVPNTNLWVHVKKDNKASHDLAIFLGFEIDSKLSSGDNIILAKKVVPYKHG